MWHRQYFIWCVNPSFLSFIAWPLQVISQNEADYFFDSLRQVTDWNRRNRPGKDGKENASMTRSSMRCCVELESSWSIQYDSLHLAKCLAESCIIFVCTYMVNTCTSSKIQWPDAAKHWLSKTLEHFWGGTSPEIWNWYRIFFWPVVSKTHSWIYASYTGWPSNTKKQPNTLANRFFTEYHSHFLSF